MSRIGRNPITIPDGVTVKPKGQSIRVEGKQGVLTVPWFSQYLAIKQEDGKLWVNPRRSHAKRIRQLWGTQCRLISSAIEGITKGFKKSLEIKGIGMRAKLVGKILQMQLGFSHDINYNIPDDVSIKLTGDRNNIIEVSGNDKQRVGQCASNIISYHPPEVYKGKGIRYLGEQIILKEGKKK